MTTPVKFESSYVTHRLGILTEERHEYLQELKSSIQQLLEHDWKGIAGMRIPSELVSDGSIRIDSDLCEEMEQALQGIEMALEMQPWQDLSEASLAGFAALFFAYRDFKRVYEAYPLQQWLQGSEREFQELSRLHRTFGSAAGWGEAKIVFIRDDYFKEHAQGVAYRLGFEAVAGSWPYSHIDWQGAANELRRDYKMVDFMDEPYWTNA